MLRVETRLYNVCIYIYVLGSKNLPLLLLRLLSKQCLIGCLGSLNICISFLYGLSCISSSNSLAGKGLVDGWSSMTSNSPEQPPCQKQQSSMTSNSPEQPLCQKQQSSMTSNSPEQPLCQKQQSSTTSNSPEQPLCQKQQKRFVHPCQLPFSFQPRHQVEVVCVGGESAQR